METQKWVNLGLLISSLAVFLFVSKLLGFFWDAARLPIPEEWPVEPVYIISFGFSAVAGVVARRTDKVNTFLNEVALELSRVTWPTRKETVASTGVVIVLVGIAALILFVIDSLWGTMIRGLLAL